ncbi:MAG: CHASE2 domain-containing protein, partial [Candidatus Aureabacteria bacterium]|nr:CHASE2 domain-containing protein [Candidatus Auribacterota bacterium]
MIPFHSVNKIIIPLFILSLTYILVQYLPACKNLEYKYNDLDQKAAYAIRKKPALGKEAVFVLIDPKTDTAFKYRTPYPRKIIAEILIKLKSCFPRLIVMDYVFMGTSDDKQEDQRLVKAIEKTQPILFSYVQSDGSVYPVPDLFTHYAKGTGIVSLIRDSDGVHRSMRPFYFDKASMKQYYCALALLALEYFRLPFSVLDVDLTTDSLVVKDPRSPLKPAYYGKKCRMEFKHYYRLKDTQAVSFIDVYENRVSPEFFKDKVVFLGRESNIHHDIHRSPLGLELGCVIVYNIFLTYINNAFPVPLNPVYHFLLSVLLVLLSFSFLNRTSIMKKWIITLSMLVWVFLIQYLFFCLNISWRGFVPFSAILLMAVGREAYYHILIFREINKIKNLLIINPQTHLTHSSYFLARLRSLASEHKMYEETYYTGVIAINGQETGADLSAAGLRNIADMLNKKIRYRELLSWDADRKKLYFILKGERSGKMEKRLKKYFFEPVLSYLKNNLTAQAAVSIVFLKSGSIFPHSVYGFLDAMDSEVKKSKDTPIHYMDHFQPTRLHDEEMEYNMFSDTKYVLEQIQNTLSLDEKLKLSEKEIRISNKLAGVGKIAAQIAHELKNPLGNIL